MVARQRLVVALKHVRDFHDVADVDVRQNFHQVHDVVWRAGLYVLQLSVGITSFSYTRLPVRAATVERSQVSQLHEKEVRRVPRHPASEGESCKGRKKKESATTWKKRSAFFNRERKKIDNEA